MDYSPYIPPPPEFALLDSFMSKSDTVTMQCYGKQNTNSAFVLSVWVAASSLSACNGSSPNAPSAANAADGFEPLASIESFGYEGAFRMSTDEYGDSSLSYSLGVIEVDAGSLYIVGHAQTQGIAEFAIPELIMSDVAAELNSAGAPLQPFSNVINRVSDGNPEGIDYIAGIESYEGQLIINALEYYDAAADNTVSTFVISDRSNIKESTISGFYELPGAARVAGWISKLPVEWQTKLGKTHLAGNSTGTTAIISRHSVGPSAHVFNASDIINNNPGSVIETERLLEFSLDKPLHDDLFNETLSNELWTFVSQAVFGFVVPGTRTYATFGSSGGNESGVGYKIVQDDGNLCGGYCSNTVTDNYNYYWFWDMDELSEVQMGLRQPHEVSPYAYGEFDLPFQEQGFNKIGGASYDAATKRLYMSITRADQTAGPYTFAPIIVAYRIEI